MRRTLEIPVAEIVPTEDAVLRTLAVPSGREPSAPVREVLARALDLFRETALPRAVVKEIAKGAFADVYEGEGDNEEPSPLATVFPAAERLWLFAATVGPAISDRIAALFEEGRFALGATLDAAASEGAERCGGYLDRVVLEDALRAGDVSRAARILRYSPGYCGWNMTGQRALFAALGPAEIGITLNESCLMEPLKSISGVMVAGPPEIHAFDAEHPVCTECRTRDCLARVRRLRVTEPEGESDGGA